MNGAVLRRLALAIAGVLLATGAPRAEDSIPVRTLFAESDVIRVTVGPSGRWAVAAVRDEDGQPRLLAQRFGGTQVEAVLPHEDPVRDFRWVDGDTLLLALERSAADRRYAVTLRESGDGIAVESRLLETEGRLVDPLVRDESSVLWAFEQDGFTRVHRAAFADAIGYDPSWQEHHAGRGKTIKRRVKLGEAVVRVEGSARSFVVDRSGVVRAALSRVGGSTSLVYWDPEEEGFRELARFADDEAPIEPKAMAPDGENLLVLAYGDANAISLFEFDVSRDVDEPEEPVSRRARIAEWLFEIDPRRGPTGRARIAARLFGLDDAQLTDVLVDDASRELVGVEYEVAGDTRYHYFDAYRDRHLPGVERRFPDQHVALASASADRSAFALWTSGPTNPGTWYLHGRGTAGFVPIAQRPDAPEPELLQEVEVLEVESSDETRIETFLAVPESQGDGPVPLVVIPHGGPIGFGEDLDFDPLQQYLASWGMATLKVRYRRTPGSDPDLPGAGHGQWSRGIEDDIDAAVELAMGRPDVDASRVCVVGGSFGGYSALVSVLRHPMRYRCAASLNGVTDIPFQFESSELADDERLRARFAEIVGDPDEDLDALIEISPLFSTDQIRTPLLIVYGTGDRRVDPDHSYRLMVMLDLLGKPYEQLPVEGAGHSFTADEWLEVATALRRFLVEHLIEPGDAAPPDAEPEKTRGSSAAVSSPSG